jgi:hypothetical protein
LRLPSLQEGYKFLAVDDDEEGREEGRGKNLTKVHVVIVMSEESGVAGEGGSVEDHHTICLFPLMCPALHIAMRANSLSFRLWNNSHFLS